MTGKVSLRSLSTGVPGLDTVLGGGVPEYSLNLITGAPGSGKTTLAHQLMFALAGQERRALFFTVLGEPPLKMLRYQQQFGFFDLGKVGESIRYVNLAGDLRAGDFSGVLERITREVEDFSPGLVFVDSFRSVVQMARSGNEGVADLQCFVQELGTRLTSWLATTFLIGEFTEGDPIMTVADGVLSLSGTQDRDSVVRKIGVVKMRGQAHMAGAHTFRISSGGLRIYPRLLPTLAADGEPGHEMDTGARRIPTGVSGLDAMLHGGLPQGYSVLVAGPSGAGKTILGTCFLKEGAQLGEKGVAACFEYGATRQSNAALAALVQSGDVAVVGSHSPDLTVDELIDGLLETIGRTGATRVLIDSLSALTLRLADGAREDLRQAVSRLLTALAERGVSVLVTTGLGDHTCQPDDISFLADAVVAMRHADVEGTLRKYISVVKVRGSSHSHELREYQITGDGLVIGSSPASG